MIASPCFAFSQPVPNAANMVCSEIYTFESLGLIPSAPFRLHLDVCDSCSRMLILLEGNMPPLLHDRSPPDFPSVAHSSPRWLLDHFGALKGFLVLIIRKPMIMIASSCPYSPIHPSSFALIFPKKVTPLTARILPACVPPSAR